jgi:hypothetical protein
MILEELVHNDACVTELRARLIDGITRLMQSKLGRRIIDCFELRSPAGAA